MARYTADGLEIPDQRPVSIPVGWERPLSLEEQMKRLIRTELSVRAQAMEQETFEEADDFDVDEDPDILSPYEIPQEAALEAPGGVKDLDGDPPTAPGEKSPVEAPRQPEGAS